MKRLILLTVLMSFVAIASVFAGEVEVIDAKAGFPEGPIWYQDKLFFAEYGSHIISTYDGKTVSEFWKMDGCGPSAVTVIPSGDFLVTCYDSGTIARISPEGKTMAVYKQDNKGQPFQGPNDFTVDARGGVYFTASGPWESEPIVGKIFYMNSKYEIREVANDLHYANGIVLSKDGKTLYLAESEAARVISFNVGDDGSLSDRRLFVRVGQIDEESGAWAYPDGLKMDSKGNLYIGQYSKGRIVVVSPDRKLVRTLDVPSPASPNMAFSPDEAFLYVTAVDDQNNAPYWGKVYKIPNK